MVYEQRAVNVKPHTLEAPLQCFTYTSNNTSTLTLQFVNIHQNVKLENPNYPSLHSYKMEESNKL